MATTPTATCTYDGGLHTTLTHTKSGQAVATDAPVDNQGKGAAFSPTDLLAASLLSCKLTTMAIACEGRGWQVPVMHGAVVKHMASGPRRVSKLEVDIVIEGFGGTTDDQATLEAIARGCPVARSLSPEVLVEAVFRFR